MTLSSIPAAFYSWIEHRSAKKYYALCLTITLAVTSLFLAFPRYDHYYTNTIAWKVTMLKANDLTNPLSDIDGNSFLAKKVFRLTVPVIIRILHLNREEVLAIQAIVGFLFILFAYKLAYRILEDAPSATFVAAGMAFIYAGRACFTEITYTQFDGWAYFFLLITLYSRNNLVIFLFATMAAWIDERAALALTFPILFHQIESAKDKDFSLTALIRPTVRSISIVLAIVGYLAVRLYLSHAYNMHTASGDANFSVLARNVTHTSFVFGAFTFLEGFWLFLAVLFLLGMYNRHYALLTAIIGLVLAFSVAVFCVYDLTRSGSYIFAIVFIILVYMKKFTSTATFRSLSAVSLFFCFIFPPMSYIAFNDFLYQIDKPFPWILSEILRQH